MASLQTYNSNITYLSITGISIHKNHINYDENSILCPPEKQNFQIQLQNIYPQKVKLRYYPQRIY